VTLLKGYGFGFGFMYLNVACLPNFVEKLLMLLY